MNALCKSDEMAGDRGGRIEAAAQHIQRTPATPRTFSRHHALSQETINIHLDQGSIIMMGDEVGRNFKI
jgi:hypothetical protein